MLIDCPPVELVADTQIIEKLADRTIFVVRAGDVYKRQHVYTGIDKTIKRAVPAKIIRQIRDMDLSHDSSLEYARDET